MGGHKGDSFLTIYILGIFGDISSNLSLDRCQKTSPKFYWLQGESGEMVIRGRAGGEGSFLKICIVVIFGNISSNLTLDRCQKHLKKYLTPMGARGAKRGTVFLKSNFLVLLVIFLQSWAEIDSWKLPKITWIPGGQGGSWGGVGSSFPKICILCNFGDDSSNLSWDRF